jgi:hypothetical protein
MYNVIIRLLLPLSQKLIILVSLIFLVSIVFLITSPFTKQTSYAQVQTIASFQINSSLDDINESNGQFDSTYGPDYKTIYIGGNSSSFTGLRFNNVTIPQGATISSAKIQVYSPSEAWVQMDFILAADNNANSPLFSSSLPSQRTTTNNKIIHDTNSKWNANTWQNLNEMSNVVQEIISKPDWRSGNSLSVILKGNGSFYGRKFVTSFDGNSLLSPKLTVTYTTTTVPTSTPIETVTPTTIPTIVPTAIPTDIPTPAPTAEPSNTPTLPPTPTPTPISSNETSLEYGTWTPSSWDTCSKEIHDKYFVIGADGKKYSTWHPPVDPETGCTFGHDHGPDPRLSKANNTLPAFGYAAEQEDMFEPHVGYKVFIMEYGKSSDNGSIANADARMVAHMGTGGVKRYTEQFHSIEYDYIARDGSGKEFHVNGLADTGNGTGSTCGGDNNTVTNQGERDGGKDFSTVGCSDSYEIWNNVNFVIKSPQGDADSFHALLYASGSWAVFDPITTRDPNDSTKLIFSQDYYATVHYPPVWPPAFFQAGKDPLSPSSSFLGCQREAYFGPNYVNNTTGSTIVYTDSRGNLKSGPGPGIIKQMVAAINNGNNIIFKFPGQGNCTTNANIHAPN